VPSIAASRVGLDDSFCFLLFRSLILLDFSFSSEVLGESQMLRLLADLKDEKVLFQFGKCRTIFASGVSRGKVFNT
jgi:hypothetical protein